jgi:N-succinyldiaminopimelate aminotransferase
MNPYLSHLQPYPFQKLAKLFEGSKPRSGLSPISLSIGEPKHPTPAFIRQALADNLDGLASYPATAGGEPLRAAIAAWLRKRYRLDALDSARQVLPVNGSREALFAFAQAIVDGTRGGARVAMPNPFYQIYEGATLLAGAAPEFINISADSGYRLDLTQIPESVWAVTQLLYLCSPGNPTGDVMTLADWEDVFALSDRHGIVIASDECYSEIYFDESAPPLGGLEAAQRLGREGFPRLVVFGSLSKRSNVPGMRSGFAAGDAAILEKFLLYRTYHGSAMSLAVQAASRAAWEDEDHVRENRRLYRQKFEAVSAILREVTEVRMPDAGFYLWLRTPISDIDFAQRLRETYNVSVLPGSFLAREAHGVNPGERFVRIALVSTPEECSDAAQRLRAFIAELR